MHVQNFPVSFYPHLDGKKSVFSEGCSSWYKLGKNEGRIVGLWPGKTLTHDYQT